jgi:hypothetical protein
MVEAVFGAEHVRNSVSGFSPGSLTMVAGRVAQRVGAGQAVGVGVAVGGSSSAEPYSADPTPPPSDLWMQMGNLVDRAGNRITGMADRFTGASDVPAAAPAESSDPIPFRQRAMLAAITLVVIGCAAGTTAGVHPGVYAVFAILAGLGATLGVALSRRLFAGAMREDYFYWRIPIAGMAGVLALFFSFFVVAGAELKTGGSLLSTVLAVGIALCIFDWRLPPNRRQRVSGQPIFYTCVAGLVLGGMFHGVPMLAAGILAAVTLASQIVAPFETGGSRPAKTRNRKAETADLERTVQMPPPIPPASPRLSPVSASIAASVAASVAAQPVAGASWGASQPPAVARASTSGVTLTSIATFPIALAGHIVLVLSALLGIAVAIDLPAAVASGIFNPGLKAELDKQFGSQTWHTLVRSLGYVVLCAGIFVANALLIFARRWDGVAHMVRALGASLMLMGAVRFLHGACAASWVALAQNPATAQPNTAMERFLTSMSAPMAGFALLLALMSLITVLWPARQQSQLPVVQEAKP